MLGLPHWVISQSQGTMAMLTHWHFYFSCIPHLIGIPATMLCHFGGLQMHYQAVDISCGMYTESEYFITQVLYSMEMIGNLSLMLFWCFVFAHAGKLGCTHFAGQCWKTKLYSFFWSTHAETLSCTHFGGQLILKNWAAFILLVSPSWKTRFYSFFWSAPAEKISCTYFAAQLKLKN